MNTQSIERSERAFFMIDLYFDHLDQSQRQALVDRILKERDENWDDFIVDEGLKYYSRPAVDEHGWLWVLAATLFLIFMIWMSVN